MKKIIYSIVVVIIGIMCLFGINYNNKEKEILQDIINYQVKSEDFYTPNSYYDYINALNEAKIIEDKIFTSKDDINDAIYNLQAKIDNLYIKPDKTILKNKYEDAIKIDLDLYLPNSILDLEKAISYADNVINDDNVAIEDIDKAINKLDHALKLLVVKPDKTVLNNLIVKANAIDKDIYTALTYDSLKTSISNAYSIIYDINATQSQVDDAIKLINDSINNLEITHKGVYKITYMAYMISNNHVGNEWGYSLLYNYDEFENGELITATIDSNITVRIEIYEYDKIMDYGSSNIDLILKDGYEATTRVTVRENRGRYYGNTATWEVRCYVKLVEVIS